MPDTTAASPLSEERVREYEQMLAAVTPGPWATHERCESPLWFTTNTVSAPSDGPLGHRVLLQLNHYFDHDADARFIAASPTIVADLLADRTALTARLEAVERDAKLLDALAEYVMDGKASLYRQRWAEGVTIGIEPLTGSRAAFEAEPHATSHEALRATLEELAASRS